jgi:hypothetical protein
VAKVTSSLGKKDVYGHRQMPELPIHIYRARAAMVLDALVSL